MPVTANSYVSAQTPNRGVVEFIGTTDATAALKSLYIGGANGSNVYGAIAVNNGATAHLLTLVINNSGGTVLSQLNAVNIPASAGNNGTVLPVSLMAAAVWPGLAVDPNGNPFLRVNNGDTLSGKYATAQATTETLSLYCLADDY